MRRLAWLLVGTLLPIAGAAVGVSAAHADAPTTVVRASFADYPREHPGPVGKPPSAGRSSCGLPATDLCTDFKDGGFRWAQLRVPYYVNQASAPRGLKVVSAVDAAFATWQNEVKSADVEEIYGNDAPSISYTDQGSFTAVGAVFDGHNVVSFADLSASCQRCLAVTTYWSYPGTRTLAEFDITLNTAYPWSTTGSPTAYDVQDVVTHEAGHTLVLGDLYKAQDAELTMYGYTGLGESGKDTLGAGDVLGLRKAYPAA